MTVLLSAWAATVVLLFSTHPPAIAVSRARRRLAALTAAMVFMLALFAVTPDKGIARVHEAQYGRHPTVAAYFLVFLAALGIFAVDIGRMCWRYGRAADREVVRLGLQLIAASSFAAVSYVVNKAATTGSDVLHLELPLGDEVRISRVLIVAGTLLVLAGTTVSVWGSRLGVERFYAWNRTWRSHRRLFPVWSALYAVAPEIALYPPGRFARLGGIRDLDFRLHRRVIEIRDGLLSIRAYVDPEVAIRYRRDGEVAGLSGDLLEAWVEAAALAHAIDNKARRAPARGPRLLPPFHDVGSDGEVAWLESVASAYRRLPPELRWGGGRRVLTDVAG